MSESDSTNIPYGYCQCGCGQKTNISKRNYPERNQLKGEPCRFVAGHYSPEQRRVGKPPRPRGVCKTEGCGRPQRKMGQHKDGGQRWGTLCTRCNRQKYSPPSNTVSRRLAKRAKPTKMPKSKRLPEDRYKASATEQAQKTRTWLRRLREAPCIRCGWSDGPTQTHRILPGSKGGKYEVGNVVPLCPNCHWLITRGIIHEYTA